MHCLSKYKEVHMKGFVFVLSRTLVHSVMLYCLQQTSAGIGAWRETQYEQGKYRNIPGKLKVIINGFLYLRK